MPAFRIHRTVSSRYGASHICGAVSRFWRARRLCLDVIPMGVVFPSRSVGSSALASCWSTKDAQAITHYSVIPR